MKNVLKALAALAIVAAGMAAVVIINPDSAVAVTKVAAILTTVLIMVTVFGGGFILMVKYPKIFATAISILTLGLLLLAMGVMIFYPIVEALYHRLQLPGF